MLTQDADGALHVLRAAADGTTTDLAVTGLPSGAQPTGTLDGTFRTYVVGGVGSDQSITFNDSWLVVNRKAIRVDSAPGTAPAPVIFPAKPLAVVGDQLLSGDPDFISSPADEALTATSLATGARRTVLADADGAFRATPDGGLLATAGATASDFHVYRVLPAGGGDVSAQPVFTVPPVRAKVDGLMVAGGELLMFGNATPTPAGTRRTPYRWTPRASPPASRSAAARSSAPRRVSAATPPAPSWRPSATAASPTSTPTRTARSRCTSPGTPTPSSPNPPAPPPAVSARAPAATSSTTAEPPPPRRSPTSPAEPAARPRSTAPAAPPRSGASACGLPAPPRAASSRTTSRPSGTSPP
ncbi:hypothetical protein [Streptomyces sp. NPDC050988]|uniref:hypothetical protein n=1 Tax=Streptomyces sp. NPDC050988 TaxID=3365637 RepID=UPI0037872746